MSPTFVLIVWLHGTAFAIGSLSYAQCVELGRESRAMRPTAMWVCEPEHG
jgi:hypothetical protein